MHPHTRWVYRYFQPTWLHDWWRAEIIQYLESSTPPRNTPHGRTNISPVDSLPCFTVRWDWTWFRLRFHPPADICEDD
jgi:hypothetical protein